MTTQERFLKQTDRRFDGLAGRI